MPFEIFLPPYRLAEAKGIWLDRLLVDDLDDAVAKHPGKLAFAGANSMRHTEVRLTYAQLAERVERIAAGLLRLGVERGDAVAFQLPNWWEFTALVLACNRIGAVANPLMPIFRERELNYMLGFSEAKVVIVPWVWRGFGHESALDRLRAGLPCLQHVLVIGGTDPSFEKLLLAPAPSESDRREIAARRPSPNDLALIMYTSGTTGEPKGAMHTSNTLLAASTNMVRDIPLSSDDVVLMGSPYAHLTGYLYGMINPLRLGATAVALDSWTAQDAADLIQKEGCTFSMGATPFLSDLVNITPEQRGKLNTLRTMVSTNDYLLGA